MDRQGRVANANLTCCTQGFVLTIDSHACRSLAQHDAGRQERRRRRREEGRKQGKERETGEDFTFCAGAVVLSPRVATPAPFTKRHHQTESECARPEQNQMYRAVSEFVARCIYGISKHKSVSADRFCLFFSIFCHAFCLQRFFASMYKMDNAKGSRPTLRLTIEPARSPHWCSHADA